MAERTLFAGLLFGSLSSCLNSSLKISKNVGAKNASNFSPAIDSVAKRSAKPGEVVSVTGQHLTPGMLVLVNDIEVSLDVLSETAATFKMPAGTSTKLLNLTFKYGTTNLKSFDLVNDATSGDLPILVADAAAICNDLTYYDKNGAIKTGTRDCSKSSVVDCSSDGQLNCKTVAAFKAASSSNAVTGNIVSGVTIAGVTGTAIAESHSNCSTDGATGCVTTSAFKSADTSAIIASDLRINKTVAGISGTMKVTCRNAVDSSQYNYDGAITGLDGTHLTGGSANDIWDTVDTYNGWTVTSPWSTDYVCSSSNWTDVTTTNGGTTTTTCAASAANCQYKDSKSGLTVTKFVGSLETWYSAINTCYNSTFGGYAAHTWRVPTQKELMELYINGITYLLSAQFINLTNMRKDFWTSTSSGVDTTLAWTMNLASGKVQDQTKELTTGNLTICVK